MSESKAIEALVARERIADVINALFVATDARDWTRVRACLAPRVTFDMTSLAGGEPSQLAPAEITEAWEAGLRPIEHVHHQVGNLSIELQRNEATASCYGVAWHHRKTRSGNDTRTFVGSYDFHLSLMEGAWRIDLFRFNLKFIDGNLDLENS